MLPFARVALAVSPAFVLLLPATTAIAQNGMASSTAGHGDTCADAKADALRSAQSLCASYGGLARISYDTCGSNGFMATVWANYVCMSSTFR